MGKLYLVQGSVDALILQYAVTVPAVLQTSVLSRSGVATEMLVWIPLFWGMTPCRSVRNNQCFSLYEWLLSFVSSRMSRNS